MEMQTPYKSLADLLDDRCEVERRFAKGVRNALTDHKQAGNTVAIWENGKVVLVAPEDIIIPPDPYEDELA